MTRKAQATMDILLRIMSKAGAYAEYVEDSDYKGLAEVYEEAVLAEINLLMDEAREKQ